jgi:hypothetical protein
LGEISYNNTVECLHVQTATRKEKPHGTKVRDRYTQRGSWKDVLGA